MTDPSHAGLIIELMGLEEALDSADGWERDTSAYQRAQRESRTSVHIVGDGRQLTTYGVDAVRNRIAAAWKDLARITPEFRKTDNEPR